MAKFTTEEKIQAVKRYLEGAEGQKTVAESIGVTKGVLQNWIRQYQHHGEAAFGKSYTVCLQPIQRMQRTSSMRITQMAE